MLGVGCGAWVRCGGRAGRWRILRLRAADLRRCLDQPGMNQTKPKAQGKRGGYECSSNSLQVLESFDRILVGVANGLCEEDHHSACLINSVDRNPLKARAY